MPFKKDKFSSYKTLTPAKRSNDSEGAGEARQGSVIGEKRVWADSRSTAADGVAIGALGPGFQAEAVFPSPGRDETENSYVPYGAGQSDRKAKLQEERDDGLLSRDALSFRQGHGLTYACLFLFTLTVYFRPYELIPGLAGFTSMALILAVLTLMVYLPAQLSTEGSLTLLNTETKCILFLVFWALITLPIAKDPGMAWKEFSEVFIKVAIIFLVMVNVLRTRLQLSGLMWLGVAAGVYLSIQALILYSEGKFEVEGYRVEVDFGGMFGNPNDMALHLVMFAPIAFTIALAAKNRIVRIIFYSAAGVMILGNFVTQSRGGFLGLMAVAFVLIWKLGKGNRLKVLLISAFIGLLFVAVMPGNYGQRVLSIFVPSLDPVGSSNERRELLIHSLLVTARNPAGIGIGNFPIVGNRDHVTHNAYTQVSSELGWLALGAYIIFLVSPLRKLGAVERQSRWQAETRWIYYLSVGLQASIIGYMISSFFASVAYQWYIYYPIAFAVCLRRIYQAEYGGPAHSAELI